MKHETWGSDEDEEVSTCLNDRRSVERADWAENPRSTIGTLFHALSSNGRLIPQQGALGESSP